MLIKTRCFGEIDLSEDKILTFDNGLLGFEDYKRYTILFNNEDGKEQTISWLQSVDEETLAIPVINPLLIKEDYDPVVDDELLQPLGELNDDNLLVQFTQGIPDGIWCIIGVGQIPDRGLHGTEAVTGAVADGRNLRIKIGFHTMVQQHFQRRHADHPGIDSSDAQQAVQKCGSFTNYTIGSAELRKILSAFHQFHQRTDTTTVVGQGNISTAQHAGVAAFV